MLAPCRQPWHRSGSHAPEYRIEPCRPNYHCHLTRSSYPKQWLRFSRRRSYQWHWPCRFDKHWHRPNQPNRHSAWRKPNPDHTTWSRRHRSIPLLTLCHCCPHRKSWWQMKYNRFRPWLVKCWSASSPPVRCYKKSLLAPRLNLRQCCQNKPWPFSWRIGQCCSTRRSRWRNQPFPSPMSRYIRHIINSRLCRHSKKWPELCSLPIPNQQTPKQRWSYPPPYMSNRHQCIRLRPFFAHNTNQTSYL